MNSILSDKPRFGVTFGTKNSAKYPLDQSKRVILYQIRKDWWNKIRSLSSGGGEYPKKE